MKYKINALYSRQIILKSCFTYLIKNMGLSFYISFFISSSIAIYLYFSGNRNILLTIFASVSIFAILIFLRLFAHFFGKANGEFKKLIKSSQEIILREKGISFGGESHSLNWKDLHKSWSNKEVFLFFTSKDSFVICPKTTLEEKHISFINEKLLEFKVPD